MVGRVCASWRGGAAAPVRRLPIWGANSNGFSVPRFVSVLLPPALCALIPSGLVNSITFILRPLFLCSEPVVFSANQQKLL